MVRIILYLGYSHQPLIFLPLLTLLFILNSCPSNCFPNGIPDRDCSRVPNHGINVRRTPGDNGYMIIIENNPTTYQPDHMYDGKSKLAEVI